MGDFNGNLLNYNDHTPTNELLDSLPSNSVIPYILQPIRITDHSKTLTDNIFSNVVIVDAISGNLTAMISDHLPQIMIVLNVFATPPSNRSNIYERDWSNFVQINFVLDYFSIDWDDTLISEENIDYSKEAFLNKINNLLDSYAPLKKRSKYKLNLQKSISIKEKLLTKYIKMKDVKKLEFHKKYKNIRNLLSTLIKQSKHNYFNKYFEDNWNNMKNTWKGIKNMITLKNHLSDFPRTLSVNDVTISNPCDIANAFNNYFTSVAKKKKEKKKTKASVFLIDTILIISVINVKIHSLFTLVIKMR